ncbi:hypothetical protein YG56_20950 [Salmonella enterica subsp. enterica serovar Kentucky]|nr:hypothetical protein [Salmonella enterica subsp. enterica serovar Suberu]ECM8230929.1 hypothetical protein [Salmonella enterica subsp. enterica serovar Kentucky]
MHAPPKFFIETGLTGCFKFRSRRFTGRPALYVQVNIGERQYPQEPVKHHHTAWRLATMAEANILLRCCN